MISREALNQILVSLECPICEAIKRIDASGLGTVLVTDDQRRLIATVTDGDIRRAILASVDLETPVRTLLERSGHSAPVTAPIGTPPQELVLRMRQAGVRHVPILDEHGRIADLVRLGDVDVDSPAPLTAVVMAGGFATRLRPLSDKLPKSMLPVGDRPLMEHIVTQLRDAGIRQVSVTTHYKPEAIIEHFGDGHKFGVQINYVNETRPLGTAGGLKLMPPWTSTVLVINGDILTRVNYSSMLAFHREYKAIMTVGVWQYSLQVPYGVVETEGVQIQRLNEKPILQFFVNAGMYLLEPEVYPYILPQQKFDMTDVIARLLAQKQRVISFPIDDYWLDIGRQADYEKAQVDFERKVIR